MRSEINERTNKQKGERKRNSQPLSKLLTYYTLPNQKYKSKNTQMKIHIYLLIEV